MRQELIKLIEDTIKRKKKITGGIGISSNEIRQIMQGILYQLDKEISWPIEQFFSKKYGI